MEVILRKQFMKKLTKLSSKLQDQLYDRSDLFSKDKNHSILHNHSVDKAYPGCRSINVTGDYRAIFQEDGNLVTFITIGTHSELY